jgi:hypothetical protein
MDLRVYKATSPDVAAIAMPIGRLYANGRGFVPIVRQELYSDLVVMLAAEPQQGALRVGDDKTVIPAARGLPRSWDEIATGHLVIAQESVAYGWWPAIVIERKDEMLTLRYRDYPKLSACLLVQRFGSSGECPESFASSAWRAISWRM